MTGIVAAAQFSPSCDGMLALMEGHRRTIAEQGRPECWLRGEPTLEELLQDPVLLLVLRRSQTSVDEIRQLAGRVADAALH
ncbi:MAG: hypothetical protein IT561_08610 [Alphaproteobacteria bacterium]|nr:hypothetical protein [Alphaproteobacteria bacterium]